jgi:hypothetical protein
MHSLSPVPSTITSYSSSMVAGPRSLQGELARRMDASGMRRSGAEWGGGGAALLAVDGGRG